MADVAFGEGDAVGIHGGFGDWLFFSGCESNAVFVSCTKTPAARGVFSYFIGVTWH